MGALTCVSSSGRQHNVVLQVWMCASMRQWRRRCWSPNPLSEKLKNNKIWRLKVLQDGEETEFLLCGDSHGSTHKWSRTLQYMLTTYPKMHPVTPPHTLVDTKIWGGKWQFKSKHRHTLRNINHPRSMHTHTHYKQTWRENTQHSILKIKTLKMHVANTNKTLWYNVTSEIKSVHTAPTGWIIKYMYCWKVELN